MSVSVRFVLSASVATFACAAHADRANTDWFVQSGYGVFVHYLNGLQNTAGSLHSLGVETSWDECVRDFDTERFADSMAEVGAGYVIFTVTQITRHLIAPNATYDRISGYAPGEACASRDLIEDLYQSLHKRGIPLMLYFTGDGPRLDEKAGPAFGCGNPVSTEFVKKWASVAQEYGERYGEKIAGWWCDGAYSFIGYDDEKLGILAAGLKAGYPQRLVALNPGVDPQVRAYSRHEDYTCGEQNRFSEIPPTRYLDGEQWHILSFLGDFWGKPGSQYEKQELADYVYEVHQRAGVVSIDVILFRDGSLDRSQMELLKAVRQGLSSNQARIPVPPGNLAWRKQAQLLSLDGSHALSVNGGVQHARLGVDGNPETFALAGGEWPWTYQVDCVDTRQLNRIRVTFAQGYATELEFQLSEDGHHWQTVARKTGHDSQAYEATFPPVSARHVRVCGIKPDGPGQNGTQMTVAELEVYGKAD